MKTHQHTIIGALDSLCAQIRRMEQRTPGVQYSFGDLWAKEEAARDAVSAMTAELEAIGAGGVEQLRKPGCLLEIQEPCQHMQELRAYELTVSNLRAQVEALEATQAAPQAVTGGITAELAEMLERSVTGLGHYRNSQNWSEADEEHIHECNALLERFNSSDDERAAAPQPVATITGLDEFGPLLGWHEHWAKFPVGTNFYTQPAAQVVDAKAMSEWLLARRSNIGTNRESAHWGEKCWDNYTLLSEYFAAQAKQG